MPNPPYMPDGEMVAKAFIDSLEQLFGCDYELPTDISTWDQQGFIRIGPVVSSTLDIYSGIRSSIIQIESYAYASNGAFPPRWLASQNLQVVIQSCSAGQKMATAQLVLPEDYYGAALMECYAISEPRQRGGDQGGYACYITEFQFIWFPLDVASVTPAPGPDPDPSGDLPNLVLEFSSSMVWHVQHNLGYPPVFVILDEFGNELEAQVTGADDYHEFTITFSQPTAGKVVISR